MVAGVGGEGSLPPHENENKEAVRGNFNLSHLYFTYEIRRGIGIHAKSKGMGGQASVHGRGEGALLHPLEMGKKVLSEEILTSFTYVLLTKLGWDRYTIHAKWKVVGGQARVRGRGGLAPL